MRQTPDEGRMTYRLKRFGNNNKDEDNSPKTLNDKNHQASSQKFRQLTEEISVLLISFIYVPGQNRTRERERERYLVARF